MLVVESKLRRSKKSPYHFFHGGAAVYVWAVEELGDHFDFRRLGPSAEHGKIQFFRDFCGLFEGGQPRRQSSANEPFHARAVGQIKCFGGTAFEFLGWLTVRLIENGDQFRRRALQLIVDRLMSKTRDLACGDFP